MATFPASIQHLMDKHDTNSIASSGTSQHQAHDSSSQSLPQESARRSPASITYAHILKASSRRNGNESPAHPSIPTMVHSPPGHSNTLSPTVSSLSESSTARTAGSALLQTLNKVPPHQLQSAQEAENSNPPLAWKAAITNAMNLLNTYLTRFSPPPEPPPYNRNSSDRAWRRREGNERSRKNHSKGNHPRSFNDRNKGRGKDSTKQSDRLPEPPHETTSSREPIGRGPKTNHTCDKDLHETDGAVEYLKHVFTERYAQETVADFLQQSPRYTAPKPRVSSHLITSTPTKPITLTQ